MRNGVCRVPYPNADYDDLAPVVGRLQNSVQMNIEYIRRLFGVQKMRPLITWLFDQSLTSHTSHELCDFLSTRHKLIWY